MRVLLGSLTYPLANGVTTSINTSLNGFTTAGHQALIAAPHYAIGQSRPEHVTVSASEVSRWFLSALNKKERMFGLTARSELEAIARRFKPDALWLHTLTWSENAFEAVMKKLDKPKVLTYHTLVEDYGRVYAGTAGAAVMRRRSKLVANAMDAVITPSKAIATRLVGYGVTSPIYVIPTGIDMPEKGYSKTDLAKRFHFPSLAKVLLYVGRVSAEKNIEKLIMMLRPLLSTSEYVLLLIGPGDITETEKFTQNLGISRQVICSGPLPKEDTQQIYFGADCFVFASQTETQGLVIGEAMLAGVPVVALDSPIREEVYPEKIAIVIKNEKEFATDVEKVVQDEKLREKLTSEAKKYVEQNFSVELMIQRQITVFEQLTKR